MVKGINKKIDHIETLIETVATNTLKLIEKVDGLTDKVEKIEKRTSKIEEDVKDVRNDILDLGGRFVSQFAFGELAGRVYTLEKKVLSKK